MSHFYAEIIKPITCAIADNPKATRTLNVVEGGRLADNCFCFSFDKRDAQPTGLTAPHPEHVWRFDKTGISTGIPSLLITPEQFAEHFKPLYQLEQGDAFKLLQQATGRNNSYNQPKPVNVPAGTILVAKESASGHDGAYFFRHNGTSVRLHDFHTPHPYGMPIVRPEAIELIS